MENSHRRLMWHGMFLFLLGLITGFAEQHFANIRMGLAAHLEGVMNGTFLLALGALAGKCVCREQANKGPVHHSLTVPTADIAQQHFANIRMGLAAHLEGVMNGTFLLVPADALPAKQRQEQAEKSVHHSLKMRRRQVPCGYWRSGSTLSAKPVMTEEEQKHSMPHQALYGSSIAIPLRKWVPAEFSEQVGLAQLGCRLRNFK